MSNAARLRAAADPVEAHRQVFQAHYNRLKNITDEKERVRLAELIASSPGLRSVLPTADSPPEAWPFPFAAEDYMDVKEFLA